jgi:segregation and condensation protein B
MPDEMVNKVTDEKPVLDDMQPELAETAEEAAANVSEDQDLEKAEEQIEEKNGFEERQDEIDDSKKTEWTIPKPQLKQIIEGILFVSGRVLSEAMICKAVPTSRKSEVRLVIGELMTEWSDSSRGMRLMEINNGYQFRSDPICAEHIRELLKARPTRLSKPALESLAIIAYRQPVTRADIEDIRGVDSGGVLKTLLDKKLIKILGKREEPGRPLMYGTSKDFLETFHIRSLKDLPTLQEYQELTEEHRAVVDTTYSRDEVAQAEEEQDKMFVLPDTDADDSSVAKDLLQAAEDLEMAVRQVDQTVNEVLNRVPYDERDDDFDDDDGVIDGVEIIAEPRARKIVIEPDGPNLSSDLDSEEDTWEEPAYESEEDTPLDGGEENT